MTARNRFETLLERAAENRWCMKPRCTTCGALDFRDGLKRMGPALADELADVDLERVRSRPEWSGALRLALDQLGDADLMDRVLTAWLPQLEQQIRVADLVLFYYVRRGALFAPMSVEVLKRWVETCVQIALSTRDSSLVESLVYTLGSRDQGYAELMALAREMARTSAPVSKALARS